MTGHHCLLCRVQAVIAFEAFNRDQMLINVLTNGSNTSIDGSVLNFPACHCSSHDGASAAIAGSTTFFGASEPMPAQELQYGLSGRKADSVQIKHLIVNKHRHKALFEMVFLKVDHLDNNLVTVPKRTRDSNTKRYKKLCK
ncbi:MAG: hypothetical protein ACJAYW_001660 [Candidatus Azotimanducaceae bacterium]|jgi:hypothetical protein